MVGILLYDLKKGLLIEKGAIRVSFSSDVKKEILYRNFTKKIEKVCQFCGIIKFAGKINIGGKNRLNLTIDTESPAVARKIFELYKSIYGEKMDIVAYKSSPKSKKTTYTLSPEESSSSKKILEDMGIIEYKNDSINLIDEIPDFALKNLEGSKAYISGAYIATGSMSDPEKFYHVEFLINRESFAEKFSVLMSKFSIKSGISEKNQSYICYIKEADSISNLLNIMGAHENMFLFEDIRIKKQMRNDVNRIVNCEMSNLDRTVKTAVRQADAIKYIIDTKGLDALDESLRIIAKIRVENTDMSLREIGDMLKPPLSKSGVNHRLKKIEKIANKIREERDEEL